MKEPNTDCPKSLSEKEIKTGVSRAALADAPAAPRAPQALPAPAVARKTGRPTKKTNERIARILDEVRAGKPLKTAALLAGISEDTLHNWRREDEKFTALVEGAIAEAEAVLVERVQAAAKDDWRAAAFLLERRHHESWGKRTAGEAQHQHNHLHVEGDLLAKIVEARQRRDAAYEAEKAKDKEAITVEALPVEEASGT